MLVKLSSSQAINLVTVITQFNAKLLAGVSILEFTKTQATNRISFDGNVCYSWICLDVRQWWTSGRLYRARCSEINTATIELDLF